MTYDLFRAENICKPVIDKNLEFSAHIFMYLIFVSLTLEN